MDLLPNTSRGRQEQSQVVSNVFGCIDGIQIRIQSPGTTRNEREHVNRKNYHSINVQFSLIMLR